MARQNESTKSCHIRREKGEERRREGKEKGRREGRGEEEILGPRPAEIGNISCRNKIHTET